MPRWNGTAHSSTFCRILRLTIGIGPRLGSTTEPSYPKDLSRPTIFQIKHGFYGLYTLSAKYLMSASTIHLKNGIKGRAKPQAESMLSACCSSSQLNRRLHPAPSFYKWFSEILVIVCLLFFTNTSIAGDNSDEKPWLVSLADLPRMHLKGKKVDISVYKFIGSWELNPKSDWAVFWKDLIKADFSSEVGSIKLVTSERLLANANSKTLTADSANAHFKTIIWKDEQVSVFAFRVISEKSQIAIVELDTDAQFAIYNNGTFAKEIRPSGDIELGVSVYVPVSIAKGDNTFVIKMLSHKRPPKMRVSMILDQSRDFQTAWEMNMGFLNRNIFPAGESSGAPALKWDDVLERLAVSAEIHDCLTGNLVLKKENLKKGSVIRDGPNYLKEGLYKISYAAGETYAYEYFLIGSPRGTFENLKSMLASYPGNEESAINIEAQLKRGEILFARDNYDADNREWQEKVVYTLSSLAGFVKMMRDGAPDLSKGTPGLHIRGFISQIDHSKQFYRLYVPSAYTSDQGVPLLLIMPVPVAKRNWAFIESPNMASHRQALQMSKYAEIHGFAMLWPGYKNTPEGWSYETAHIDEVIRTVKRDYNIDESKISIYGMCGGGFFAGRLAAKYPKRFAAIIYDRAYIDGGIETIPNASDSMKYWHNAIAPSRKILNNINIKILVLNDGSMPEGHGEMKVSEQFLETALKSRTDIKYFLGRRPGGVELWDTIFGWLSNCKNENYSPTPENDLELYGYTGPIHEIFSTPFIVVEGTSTSAEGITHIQDAMEALKEKYGRQFFRAGFVVKKDTEITDQDIKMHSLILIGNPRSNIVWDKLKAELPIKLEPNGLSIDGQAYPTASAFVAVSRNPVNNGNYILLIGAKELKHLTLTKSVDPTKATFDCCILEPHGEYHKRHIINTLLKREAP